MDAAAKVLKDAGARILAGPAEWDGPGSPYGIRFCDPDGNRIEICADMREWIGPENPHAAKPTKLGHVYLHVGNPARTLGFFTDVLGFHVTDWIADFFIFITCNSDHHVSALVEGPGPSMNHAGFEVEDAAAMVRAADISWKNGVETLWGLGRHGPGHNLFIYYPDPDGNVIEIFAEMDRIHDFDNYKPLQWNPEDAGCVRTRHITQKFTEGAAMVGKRANAGG